MSVDVGDEITYLGPYYVGCLIWTGEGITDNWLFYMTHITHQYQYLWSCLHFWYWYVLNWSIEWFVTTGALNQGSNPLWTGVCQSIGPVTRYQGGYDLAIILTNSEWQAHIQARFSAVSFWCIIFYNILSIYIYLLYNVHIYIYRCVIHIYIHRCVHTCMKPVNNLVEHTCKCHMCICCS